MRGMIALIFTLVLNVHGEIKTDGPDLHYDNNSSSSLQGVSDKLSQFLKCTKDPKVWPKSMFGQNPIAIIDENEKPWRWSAERGLVAVTDPKDAANIKEFGADRAWNSIDNKKPPEVVVNLKFSKDAKEGKLPPNMKPMAQTPSQDCMKAMKNQQHLNAGIPQEEQLDLATGAFSLAVHESMHVHDQSNPLCWSHNLNNNKASMERINAYPMDASPRQMRYKLKVALRRALEAPVGSKRQAYLEEAAYWHEAYTRWNKLSVKNNKTNEDSGPDIFEGSARYLELVAARIDCTKPVTAEYLAQVSREAILGGVSERPQPTSDTEAYYLGALAGSLLDQRAIDWKQKTMKGASPLDQLLKDVRPKKKGALTDTAHLDEIAAAGPKTTEECTVKPDMDYLANYKNTKKYAWVSINTHRFQGAGSYNGKSVVAESKKVHVNSSASANGLAAQSMPLVVSNNNPCGGDSHVMVLVERSDIQNGQVNYTRDGKPDATVRGPVSSTPQSSPMGDVYCGK